MSLSDRLFAAPVVVSTRRALAKAYGIPLDLFDDYLEERLTLEELIEAREVAEAP